MLGTHLKFQIGNKTHQDGWTAVTIHRRWSDDLPGVPPLPASSSRGSGDLPRCKKCTRWDSLAPHAKAGGMDWPGGATQHSRIWRSPPSLRVRGNIRSGATGVPYTLLHSTGACCMPQQHGNIEWASATSTGVKLYHAFRRRKSSAFLFSHIKTNIDRLL